MKKLQNEWVGLKNKIILKQMCTYILIFLIPITLFFLALHLINIQIFQNEEENVEQILYNNVGSIQLTMDQQIARCQSINYVLTQDENMYYLLHFVSENIGDKTVNIYNISKELKSLCLTNDNISDILICINQNGLNINQQGKISMEDAYKEYIKQDNDGYSYQQWIAETLSFTGGKLISFKDNSLYFLRSYPVTPIRTKCDSITLIKIQNSIAEQILKGVENIEGSVVSIIDDNGTNIWTTNQKKDFLSEGIAFTGSDGYITQDGYLISYKKSEQLSITYVSAIPQSFLIDKKNSINKLTGIVFAALSLLVCGLIALYSFRKSNPIRQLLSLVSANDSGKKSLLDPYSEIKSMLLDAADQKMAYMNQNEKNDFMEKKRTFIAILYDKRSTLELIRQNIEQVGIKQEGHQCCFVKLKCVDISAYFEKINNYGKIDCTPIQFCNTIFEQVLAKHFSILGIPYGQEAFIVITIEDKKIELLYNVLKDQLKQAQRLLQESYGIDILIAFSNFHSGTKGIIAGFKEVNSIMDFIEFMGDKNFYEFNAVSIYKKRNEFYTLSIKDEAMMIGYIKSCDFKNAKSIFNNLISSCYRNVYDDPLMLKFRIYALISRIMESLYFVDLSEANNIIEEFTENGELMNFQNIIEFQRAMNRLFDKMEDILKSSQGNEEDKFIKNIKDIIAHNYMNPDLNVSMIANLLNKNLDYISRTFKKITGNGLLDSIQEYRIMKAKNYINENPELSIQQISSMVGYVNCESFIRVFKHKECVTPGRYKSTIKKQKQ